jgi:hypothetical protein
VDREREPEHNRDGCAGGDERNRECFAGTASLFERDLVGELQSGRPQKGKSGRATSAQRPGSSMHFYRVALATLVA